MGSGATTRWDLEYPVPSDSVNIPGDIQGLADDLDALLFSLSCTAKSATYTATLGDLVLMTGTHTVHAPTSPAKNDMFGVINYSTGVVTIDSATFNLPGSAGVSSISLAARGSFVVLVFDGTDYDVVACSPDVAAASILTALYTSFTANKQIIMGTGTATGELIDLLAAMELEFGAANQVLLGTGSGTAALTNLATAIEGLFGSIGQLFIGTGSGTGALRQLLSVQAKSTSYAANPLEFVECTSSPTITIPVTSGSLIVVENTSTGIVTLAAASGAITSPLGTSPTLYQGDIALCISDGTNVQVALSLTNPARIPVIATTQSGTSYTFALTDSGTVVESTSGSATTFTVPTNASVAFPIGTVINCTQIGAGVLTIAAAGGVTIDTPNTLVMTHINGTLSLRKRGTNEWVISGTI